MKRDHVPHIIEKIKEYTQIPSVVGYEGPFIDYLQREFSIRGYKVERMNNFFAVHGKKPNSQIISVHIDRHGIIKTNVNEYSYAAFVVEKDWYHVDYYKNPSFLAGIYNEYINEKVLAYDYMNGDDLGQAFQRIYIISSSKIFKRKGLYLRHFPFNVGYITNLCHNTEENKEALLLLVLVMTMLNFFSKSRQS